MEECIIGITSCKRCSLFSMSFYVESVELRGVNVLAVLMNLEFWLGELCPRLLAYY